MDSMDLYKISIGEKEREIRDLDARISDCAKQEQQLYQRLKKSREDLARKQQRSQNASFLGADVARYERELDDVIKRRSEFDTRRNYAIRELEQLRQSYNNLRQAKEKKEQKKQQQQKAIKIGTAVAVGTSAALRNADSFQKQAPKKRHTARNIILFIFALALFSRFMPLDDSQVTDVPSTSQGLMSTEQIAPTATQKGNNETELADWIGKPFSEVFTQYGDNYLTDWFRGAFIYYEDNCPYNFFYYDTADGSPDLSQTVIAISTGKSGTLITNGIRIGDSLETVNTSLGQELAPKYEDGDELILPSATTMQGDYVFFWYFDEDAQHLVYVVCKLAS